MRNKRAFFAQNVYVKVQVQNATELGCKLITLFVTLRRRRMLSEHVEVKIQVHFVPDF